MVILRFLDEDLTLQTLLFIMVASDLNVVTYTNMILGYGQHGMGKKALDLFNTIKRRTIRFCNVSCGSMCLQLFLAGG
ncbi:putative tetratricopeptide-like helical domain superfamily [Helianthus debilis subsp. tardiflorus]